MRESYDAVVIGGGIVGACAAEALAGAGRRVALLERGRLAEATSGNSFAWINATSKRADADYHRLNAAGVQEYQALAQRFGAGAIGLAGHGGLHWGPAAQIDALAARLAELGYPQRRADAAALRELEPRVAVPDDAAGLVASADRWLDAPRCVARLARAVAESGGVVREATGVTGFARGADGAIAGVHTYAGTLDAPVVLVAAGTETAALVELATDGACRLPVDAVPGALVDVPPDLAAGLVASHLLFAPDGLELRPGADGGLLVAAGDFTEALRRGCASLELRRLAAEVLRRAGRVLPDLPVEAAIERSTVRVGVRPIPADEHTVAGPIAQAPGLYAAVTHSGVTLGPLLGRLLAQEIAGGAPSPLLATFRPDRFA